MIYESSNAFSFPHATKELEKALLNPEHLKTPIVGKYIENIINEPKGGFHFGKEKKLKQERPKTPGPGKYNPNNELFGQCTPKFSMGKKLKDMQFYIKKKIPGPGTYTLTETNYEKTIGKRKLFGKFPKQSKLKLEYNHVPGVGKYELTYNNFGNNNKNKFTFPKSSRKMELIKEKEKNNNALNTSLDINNKINNKSNNYSIKPLFGNEGIKPMLKGKPKYLKKLDTPGPGKYEVESGTKKILKKIPATSFGFGKKIDFGEIARKRNVPGPKYNISSEFDINDTKKIHTIKYIKSKKRKNKRYKTPGPGSYNIPCSFANTPLYQNINNKYRKI